MKKTLSVPTINDYTAANFDVLFNLWNQINNDNMDVTFEFSNCKFLPHSAVAFLGGIIRLIQARGGIVRLVLDSIPTKVKANLEKNGFLSILGFGGVSKTGNSIPYREDSYQDKVVLVDYLKMYWLERGWVHVSEMLKDVIVGTVWEIYANAFEHRESPVGIFSCGQYYPRRHELKLTVVDFGVGIPSNVRLFFKPDPRAQSLSAASCLKWAFQRGMTTKPDSRGMGLDLLKEFVKLNKGKLEVFSHEGYAIIDSEQEQFVNRTTFFEGTLVNITFICDESHYRFASERVEEPLF
ncbi:MAG: ATP-binding protein [Candidatus Desantisbacteria bacterium]